MGYFSSLRRNAGVCGGISSGGCRGAAWCLDILGILYFLEDSTETKGAEQKNTPLCTLATLGVRARPVIFRTQVDWIHAANASWLCCMDKPFADKGFLAPKTPNRPLDGLIQGKSLSKPLIPQGF